MGTLRFNLLFVLVGKLGHGKAGYEFLWHLRLFGGAAAPEHSSVETTASDGRRGSPTASRGGDGNGSKVSEEFYPKKMLHSSQNTSENTDVQYFFKISLAT